MGIERARKASFAVALVSVALLSTAVYAEPPPVPHPDAASFAQALTPCAPGLEALTPEACFSGPNAEASVGDDVPLVVYLHGLYQPKAPGDELSRQHRVAKHAAARGMAVLALKGRVGICDTRGDHAGWVCWPSNEKVAHRAADVVASWAPSLAKAKARTGRGPTYVLGFSNGAYFAALLAIRDLFPADAFVIAQGGPVEPVRAHGPRPPLLLLQTDGHAPVVRTEMERLASALTADGWSFVQEERPGWHELSDGDIDAALDFLAPSFGAPHQKRGLNRTPPRSSIHEPE